MVFLQILLVGYLPGALIFRCPTADRDARAKLSADERVFWQILLSVAWSLTVVLVLAALERYQFNRLLIANGGLSVVVAVLARGRLRYRSGTAPITGMALLPLLLLGLGFWRFFPPAEYIIGGKDPGVYVSEGVQIAQRGTLTIHDPVVAAVPASARDLFFPRYPTSDYYSSRFMGFFLRDPSSGDVNGQFPQLLPISMAIGYGLDGLTGVRMTTGVWGLLGLLSVYFLGARLVGRPAALAAAALLALNVADVWFARYPNSDLAGQALLFAACLAFARAHQDGQGFFAPAAAVLIGLSLFARIETLPVIGALFAAGVLSWFVKADARPLRLAFVLPLLPFLVAGWFYYNGPLWPYFVRAVGFLRSLSHLAVIGSALALVAGLPLLLLLRWKVASRVRQLLPTVLAGALVIVAVYAAFFREPGGRLAAHDAHALRTFTNLYLLWPGLVAAVIGMFIVIRREFWRDPAFILVFSGLSLFFFYKIQIVPTEFWAARRVLPISLPGALIFAAAAGLGPATRWVWPRRVAGVALVGVLAFQYVVNAAPVMPHVEYAGIIPALEQLAARFGDRDLVLVEARDAGADTHVLALPLAYIYARNVLVLNSARPDKVQLRNFLEDALKKYPHVYFVGGGGTDLLSRRIGARPIADASVKVPEFESTEDRLPAEVRRKDFDYSVYELTLDAPRQGPFSLDLGRQDDLNVVRFQAKETTEGRTIRWTRPGSTIAITGMTGAEREVELVMHDGGRPAQAPPAHVEVYLSGVRLGGADVRPGFLPYRFPIPADAAARAAATDDPAQLTLVSTVWIPQQIFGGTDTRQLGVMVDRVEVR